MSSGKRNGTLVAAAAQSSTSFIPPLGRDKAKVLALNLRNRMIFCAADKDGALESREFLGKRPLSGVPGIFGRET